MMSFSAMMFSCLNCRRILISRSIRLESVEFWKAHETFLIATLPLELLSFAPASVSIRDDEEDVCFAEQTTPYAPRPTGLIGT